MEAILECARPQETKFADNVREMRVGLDAGCLNREHIRGMGKYVASMMAQFPASQPIHWDLFGQRPDLPMHHPPMDNVSVHRFTMRGSRFNTWLQIGLPRAARKQNVDILHCTSTDAPWWQPIPTVVTIHDIIPWLRSNDPHDQMAGSVYQNQLLPRVFRKCAAIITISENSRSDIVSMWPELIDKLHVITHGIDQHYLDYTPTHSDQLSRLGIIQPYFLYLGGDAPRKRLEWALQVFEATTGINPHAQLVVCGLPESNRKQFLERLAPAIRGRVMLLPFVPEEAMPELYASAAAVLYPTLYEGFGLPALEAQAVGTPILFSDVGSLGELIGPGSIVLPVEDFEAWKTAAGRCLEQRGEHPEPIDEARQWARQFSWARSAERHSDVYQLAIGQSR
ncbi:MAG: glycosyltransferase family 1 protein [Planctomycetota bacterium]|nr:glycosyltransferase family 1 protein [Planctomycetota bacterium]